jgi:putative heme-binding domain-containing protein
MQLSRFVPSFICVLAAAAFGHVAIGLLSPARGAEPGKQFASAVITQETEGHRTAIEVDIRDAKLLILEVTDGGDGTSYDWADWIEPRLINADGELKLTDLKWRELRGKASIDKNQGGNSLKVGGKPVPYGIGTHAKSTIIYDLPSGYSTFKAEGGLDNGGTDQSGSTTSVQFRAYTSLDTHFEEPVNLKLPEGFVVRRIFADSVGAIGSWVALGVDGSGRLITADRQGPLYRITIPVDETSQAKVEALPVEVGGANGLLEAFGSFYVVGIGRGEWQGKSGLFRLNDTNGDDHYDKVEFLIPLTVGGDHHAHAVILNPDKTGLMILCGNSTDAPGDLASRHIRNQAEDHLLPRSTYYGHNTGREAPGGFVLTCAPDGTNRHFYCAGFRNPYDIALNAAGELFTFDADMEYDVGAPWYRPTRVNHAVSGGEYGWRWGAGKWPNWYPDTVATTVDIGRGSPTGIVFGYGAKFPEKYQRALYICDWTYGRIMAVHLEENGSSYSGNFEEFVAGQGNPVSDIVIHPNGNMYFVTGGRRNPTSLYEVRYVGDKPANVVDVTPAATAGRDLRKIRRKLESYHGTTSPEAVAFAWPYLSHRDRHIRYAARTVLEHQPVSSWAEKALKETEAVPLIQCAVAVARSGEGPWKRLILNKLNRLDVPTLNLEQQLDLLRAYGLMFIRMGEPDLATTTHLVNAFSPLYPSGSMSLDHELCQMLLYLNAPDAVTRTVRQLKSADTQAEQMFYAYHLRTVPAGWSTEDLRTYVAWLQTALKNQEGYIGGGHFGNFLTMVDSEANKRMSDDQQKLVADIRENLKPSEPTIELAPRDFVQKWTVADLELHLSSAETGRSFIRGRNLYQGMCAKCHLFKGKGGAVGPDLTSTGSKLKYAQLLTEIIEPSKVISDQHASVILELESGKILAGREVGGDKDTLRLVTDPEKPTEVVEVQRAEIVDRQISKVSLMPLGMLDTLSKDEIFDMMLYLSSGGNAGNRAFQQ